MNSEFTADQIDKPYVYCCPSDCNFDSHFCSHYDKNF